MKNNKKKITKDINLKKLIEDYPESVEAMMEFGLHCIGCVAASFETLEEGMKAHGCSDKDIKKVVKDINKKIK